MASSMLGSGGILLAVSLVTTGLTYMAQNGITVEDVFNKLNGTFDENAHALAEINKEAAKTAGEEVAGIKGLAAAASDVTLSYDKRILAVKKLQDDYPAYFGNLTKEQILNGQVAGAIDEVSNALRARAVATAIAGKLGENAAKRLDLEAKREELILKIKKAQAEAAKEAKGEGSFLEDGAAILKPLATVYKSVVNSIKELDAQSKKLSDREAQATKDSIGLLETQTAAEKKLASEKAKAAADKKSGKEIDVTPKVTALPDLETTAEVADRYLKAFQKVFGDQLKNKIQPIALDIPPVVIPFKVSPEFIDKDAKEKLDSLVNRYKYLTGEDLELPEVITNNYINSLGRAMQATDLFASASSSAISSLASDLASNLETGNSALDAFVGSVIKAFADIAAAQLAGLIAKQAIATASISTDAAVATGNAVVAGSETAAASGPAAAFVLPALVGAAIGFIAASFAGIKFAHGGIVPGGSFTGDKIPAMLNSGEAVLNSQQQSNMLMAVANGNANSLQGNRKSSTFSFESKVRGDDLLLLLKRAEKKR